MCPTSLLRTGAQKVAAIAFIASLLVAACGDDGGGGGRTDPDQGVFVPDTGDDVDDGDAADRDADLDVEERAPIEDVGDARLPDAPVLPTFQETCAFASASCLDQATTAVSCAIGTDVTDVVYTDIAVRLQTAGANVRFDAVDRDGNHCAGGLAVREPFAPDTVVAWLFDAEQGQHRVEAAEETGMVRVTCADGSSVLIADESFAPFAPDFPTAEDGNCVAAIDNECRTDAVCGGACCGIADSGRCVDGGCFPALNQLSPELASCLDPMLTCLGTGALISGCSGRGDVSDHLWLEGRSGTLADNGDGTVDLRVERDGELCFDATFTGSVAEWSEVVFTPPEGDAVVVTAIEGRTAQVVCGAAQPVQFDIARMQRYLPEVAAPGTLLCPETCDGPDDCGGDACCPNAAVGGMTCRPGFPSCPVVGPLTGTCIEETLECFGDDLEVSICRQWDLPFFQHAQISYVGGRSATSLRSRGEDLVRSRTRVGDVCFEYVPLDDQSGELRSAQGPVFGIVRDGADVVVTCPDATTDRIPADVFDDYVPQTLPMGCFLQNREEVCTDTSGCEDGFVCCDRGLVLECWAPNFCFEPQPTCTTDAHCGGGSCCPAEDAWVCDADVCGGQFCCYADTDVCIDGACP